MSHPLEDPWPPFLDWIRSDDKKTRERGLVAFFEFLHKLAKARPPAVFSRLQPADRDDVLSKVYLQCSQGALLKYRKRDSSFAAWLSVFIRYRVLDYIRSIKVTEEFSKDFPGGPNSGFEDDIDNVEDDALKECLDKAPAHYRRAVSWIAEGLLPMDVLKLGAMPEDWGNKRIGDLFKDAVRSLRRCLGRLKKSAVPEADA